MKKILVVFIILACLLGLTSCVSKEPYTIEFTIPPGSSDGFIYSDQEIFPNRNKLIIRAGAGISERDIILKPVQVQQENAYEPVTLKQEDSVKIRVEKGAWYKIGVAAHNPNDVPIAVEIIVENSTIRIE